MNLQQLYSYTRKAVDDYQLIDEGDRIAVGVSGGKDSLTLLYALKGLSRFYPKRFELMAVSVDLGFDGFSLDPIRKLCEELQVPYHVVPTQIGEILFEERKEKNPCALCAKMRKGALNQAVKDLGFDKVAYAHHKDDVIETMLLSLLFEGHFYSFPPKTHLERTDLTVIRPLIYVNESDIKGFRYKYDLPVVENPCPMDGHSKREYAKQLLHQLNKDHPGVRERLFTSIVTGNIPDWPPKQPYHRN